MLQVLPRPVLFLLVTVVESLLITSFLPGYVPRAFFTRIVVCSTGFNLLLWWSWSAVIYPVCFSPLRHLPSPNIWLASDKVVFSKGPRGANILEWIKAVPNDGLIRVRSIDGTTGIIVTNPRAISDVLSHYTYDYEKPYLPRRVISRIIGWGLVSAEGNQHSAQRKAVLPAFNVRNIRALYPLMWEKSNLLLQRLADQIVANPAPAVPGIANTNGAGVGLVEISEWASRLTLDIIGPAALGRDFQSLQNQENVLARSYLDLFEPSLGKFMFFALGISFPPWIAENIPGRVNKAITQNVDLIRRMCLQVVKEKRKALATEKTESHDILSAILRGGEIGDDACVDQMLTFLAAGHETTASALTWCSYLLSKHPTVQSAVRAEIRTRIPTCDTPITGALLESLPYLNGVCNEVLRLYPTIPVTVRQAMRPTTIANHPIPAGTWVFLCPWATNRDPAFWGADAETFRPERWIDVDEKTASIRVNKSGGAESNHAMLTFLHGPRSCIGQGFAKAELRCAVAALVGRFEMSLQKPDEQVVIGGMVTQKPRGGLHLRLKNLEGW